MHVYIVSSPYRAFLLLDWKNPTLKPFSNSKVLISKEQSWISYLTFGTSTKIQFQPTKPWSP